MMWIISKWDSQGIYTETVFLFMNLELEIYTKILMLMAYALGKYILEDDIMSLLKCISQQYSGRE